MHEAFFSYYSFGKRNFDFLRKRSSFFCTVLDTHVIVTYKFYDHIACYSKKKRHIDDTIERLLMIPLIDEILAQGILFEKRILKKYIYFEISYTIDVVTYSVILRQSKTQVILLSCFVKNKTKRPVGGSIAL